jgi:hypothetical protein
LFLPEIALVGNENPHQIQSSVNISCSSDLEVQTIRWLNNSDNGRELLRATRQQGLHLPIRRATLSLANTTYTCRVEVRLSSGIEIVEEEILLRVDGMMKTEFITSHFALFYS